MLKSYTCIMINLFVFPLHTSQLLKFYHLCVNACGHVNYLMTSKILNNKSKYTGFQYCMTFYHCDFVSCDVIKRTSS